MKVESPVNYAEQTTSLHSCLNALGWALRDKKWSEALQKVKTMQGDLRELREFIERHT